MNLFVIVLVCLMAVAAAVDEKPEADLNTSIEAPADQDVDDWYNRRYYGHYYNTPYGYYGYRHGKHWRGRRSAGDIQPEADLEANEHHRRGYYSYYNPYGYRNYYGKYRYWRG